MLSVEAPKLGLHRSQPTSRRQLITGRDPVQWRARNLLPICPTKTGKRWQRRSLAREARLIARSIGLLDELQLRDLRRTAATEAASAGVTPWEMMAAGGWQNQASIRPYLIWTPEQAASFQAKREAYRRDRKS